MLSAHVYIGRLPRFVRYTYDAQVDQACECVDLYGGGGAGVGGARDTNEGMTVRERLKHLSAPVGWRDEVMIGVMARFLGMYKDRQEVDYWEAIRDLGFIDCLEGVEGAMRGNVGMPPIQEGNKKKKPTKYIKPKTKPTNEVLSTLESFHKTAVMYIWLSYRMPVVYAQQEEVVGVKKRVEGALEWCLEGMTTGKEKSEEENTADMVARLTAWAKKREGTKDEVKGSTDSTVISL